MQKSIHNVYLALLALTMVVALVSTLPVSHVLLIAIVVFSLVKFWLVSFYFLEVRKAHIFWKVMIVLFGLTVGFSCFVLL